MKKLLFGALALAMLTVTSCRNENTEVTEETAVNAETTPEVTPEIDSLEVKMEVKADSLETATEVEQATPAVQ